MAFLAVLTFGLGTMPAQTDEIEFHYLFSPESPDADSSPQNHTLVLGSDAGIANDPAAESLTGIKVSPTLQGRVYFEDMNGDGLAILSRLQNSEWTLEFWIKLDELSDRSQMLFAVQPVKKSHSDINVRLVPEPTSVDAGTINITDSTGITLASSPAFEWTPGIWYYLVITSTPMEGGRVFTFHRVKKDAPNSIETSSGNAKPLVFLTDESPRVYNFANFWGNFGKDALRGTMSNIRLSWKSKNEEEVLTNFRQTEKP